MGLLESLARNDSAFYTHEFSRVSNYDFVFMYGVGSS